MKVLLAATLAAIVGCAGAQPGEKSENGQTASLPTEDGASDVNEDGAQSVDAETLLIAVQGTWENASCGYRKYNRKVVFQSGGQFNAVDEIAPCPEGKECDLSGIIEWNGTWDLQDKNISMEPAKSLNERMPETLPDSFVILIEDPISIGEKTGTLVCPYTKVQ